MHEEIIPLLRSLKENGTLIGLISNCFSEEAAEKFGMHAVQAVWYLRDGIGQPIGRKAGFLQMETPMQVLDEIKKVR